MARTQLFYCIRDSDVRYLIREIKDSRLTMTLKVNRSYLDGNFETQTVTAEGTFEEYKDKDAAIAGIGETNLLRALNAGAKALKQEELGKELESKLPANAISEDAYSSLFDSFRPRLEAKGIEGIKNLREEFRKLVKGNQRLQDQIKSMTEALKIEI